MENSEQILYNISNLIRENKLFPVIIFFMFTQKFFVQGIATSGIKS